MGDCVSAEVKHHSLPRLPVPSNRPLLFFHSLITDETDTITQTMHVPFNTERWQALLRMFNAADLFSSAGHSNDFRYSRAHYIYARVRVLSLILAPLTLLWLPLDYFLLPRENFPLFASLRLTTVAAFLFLGFWTTHAYSLLHAYLRLGILIIVPSLFYLVVFLVLHAEYTPGSITGYEHFPFLLITIGAIFPLTLIEGASAVAVVLFIFIALKAYLGVFFTAQMFDNLWLMSLLAGIALWTELAQLHILLGLYRQATRDPLTGLFNRRILMTHLQQALEQTRREHRPLCVLLFDLDKFKRINDTYGHLSGDVILQTFASILEAHICEPCMVGRYGGEEFLAILPNTGKVTAIALAENIRHACYDASACPPGREVLHFTVSVGAAELRQDENIEGLLNRVDERLYFAKETGRDRVVFA